MAAFNVTNIDLASFGYSETTDFSDPMDARWRAQPFNQGDFAARGGIFTEDAIVQRVQQLALEQPYSELDQAENALDQFWQTNGAGNPNSPRDAAPVSDTSAGPIPRYRRFVV